MKGKSAHSQMFLSPKGKKKIKMKQSKMPQKLQKEVSTDCRLLPSALPHCPRSAEG